VPTIALLILRLVLGAPVEPGSRLPALTEAGKRHLRAETLGPVARVSTLPLPVRELLQSLFKTTTLEMADPGADFQATDVIRTPGLPFRRLVLAGCSADHCLIEYEKGGIAHTFDTMLIAVSPKQATLQWGGWGGAGVRTLAELKDVVIQGGLGVDPDKAYW
jgi:hypothetical protein